MGLWILLSGAAPSTAQTSVFRGVTGGMIQDVTDSGGLVFEGGVSGSLWGLEIVDRKAAQDLLIGRRASCVVVTQVDGALAVDCNIAPKSRAVGTGLDWINLLVWLPELGIARMVCNVQDVTQGSEWHENKRFYRCDLGTVPWREPPSPPTAPLGGVY
jgi:hypothetical protein